MAFTLLYSDEQNSEPVVSTTHHQLFQSKYMVDVPIEFVLDQFNHTDLKQYFLRYNEAFDQLTNALSANDEDLISDVEPMILYGLLHKRYVQSDAGLSKMHKLVLNKTFGTCLRQGCDDCLLAPISVSDKPGIAPFCVYCCKCNCVYQFYGENEVDGSFFGTDLAHLLFLKYPNTEEKLKSQKDIDEEMVYCGKQLFGFEIAWDKMK
ncbi:Casein_kinase II subunit beta [Hexamita inflata]|uniref:Casein kinase II subunit beta n=1 Tax=Hexamita inflata TaxID=28002 RepID=A0ABP1J048_9EUKA